ncbi:carbohydrate kinase family protein [Cohnella sp. JJ-181]|uniref:carbohydrate kinase family protein n=1 Tax=Cohnella rhizoplanae TaxID=2974897 RepID=UPI0022FFA5CA|nr:carbohydrate kinase family protein [Cohnella sp. JJ-181]CAI6084896.1 5-dehydro-2-deoxygluconokinase [Cohnella sp. JJ-181]
MASTVIGIGDFTVDLYLPRLDRLPEWGQETIIGEPRRKLGGNIGNMAIAASALRTPFAGMGWIGNDNEGRFLQEEIRRLGLPTEGMALHETERTSQTFACIRKDGERLFLTYPGVLDRMEQLFREMSLPSGNIVFLSGWCLPPRVPLALFVDRVQAWKREGRLVAVDLIWSEESWASREPVLSALIACDAVFLNADELRAITALQDVDDAAKQLERTLSEASNSDAAPLLVVKKGKEGALAIREAVRSEARAAMMEVEHTVGAGDLFNLAFLHAYWIKNRAIAEALSFACTFAGLSIQKNADGCPTENEVLHYIAKGGVGIDGSR